MSNVANTTLKTETLQFNVKGIINAQEIVKVSRQGYDIVLYLFLEYYYSQSAILLCENSESEEWGLQL